MAQLTQPQGNPILEKDLTLINSWKQWKELWQNTTQAEFLDSLLHFGLEVRTHSFEETGERLLFYIEVADGHADYRFTFEKQGDRQRETELVGWGSPLHTVFGRDVESLARIRMILARKAFQMLCQHVFKKGNDRDRFMPDWAKLTENHLLMDRPILNRLLWFFRIDSSDMIPNLPLGHTDHPDNHHVEVAKDFLLNLCTLAWECSNLGNYFRRTNPDTQVLLRKIQPDTIAPLFGLRRLDVLLNRRYEVDETCMQRLKELALNRELQLPSTDSYGIETRKPSSLGEASLGGSQAAEVLLILQERRTQKTRLDKVRELEMQRKQTEERLRKIKGP